MTAPNIYIANASLAYHGEQIFTNLDLHLPAGKWTALLGPSGIGKSSLLRLIAGMSMPEQTSSGIISADNNLKVNSQTAYMGQTDLLLPWLNVLENTVIGHRLRAASRSDYASKVTSAALLLDRVGLGKVLHYYPHQLSGGMRQRAALVRTLMENKPVVLMDEPFSALDAITRHKLQALAAELLRDKTVIFITHDPVEALRLAHTIYVMCGKPAALSRIAELGTAIPRALNDADVMRLQISLFDELMKDSGE